MANKCSLCDRELGSGELKYASLGSFKPFCKACVDTFKQAKKDSKGISDEDVLQRIKQRSRSASQEQGARAVTDSEIPTPKEAVFKEQELECKKGTLTWEKGVLTLTRTRLVFLHQGEAILEVPVSQIRNVLVKHGFGYGEEYMEVRYDSGEGPVTAEFRLFSGSKWAISLGQGVAGRTQIYLKSWEDAINKLRMESSASSATSEDPLHILKTRYAKGEISREEYELLKKELSS
jgi:hypothetical protein